MALFYGWVHLLQGYSHFEEALYFLPFSSQKFLVLSLSTSEGSKAESTFEPPSGFEHGTPGLGIQCLNHQAIAPEVISKKIKPPEATSGTTGRIMFSFPELTWN